MRFPILRGGKPLLTEDGVTGASGGGTPKLTPASTSSSIDSSCCCVTEGPSECCCAEFIPPGSAPATLTATIVGCGGISSGTIVMTGAVTGSCLDYTGEADVGNCGATVNLGATLDCAIVGTGTCEDLTLEIRRTTLNCTVNGGASQTLSADSGCSCDPFTARFSGYGGVDDSGLAPGTCDCCPGGTFDVVVTE